MGRVPHCNECERCQHTDVTYRDYYCCEEGSKILRFGGDKLI